SVEEVLSNAIECFVTGTAAIITSVSDIGYGGKTYHINRNDYKLANQLYDKLIGIQLQREKDPYHWVTVVE
ncbi:MAG: branched chain amino acid aminotransferase, partial [Calditrichaeota bacterium]|nr:branched chain amino acid aminotransferase [Calditrichota bacterium]